MDDLISRQAVKELAHNQIREKYCGVEFKKERDFYIRLADSIIDLLPTIQPEIVRCKDCKHWKDSDGVFRRGTGAESKCPLSLHEVYEGTFYCGLGERREVTT